MTVRPRRSPLRYLAPLLLGIAALTLVYGRFVVQARQSVRAAQLALASGDPAEATRCYLDALRAYVPGSPFERQALDGLSDLAARARAAGDPDGERRAWQAVRVGLLGTRSLVLPYPTRYAEAERRLADLEAAAAFPPAGASPRELALVPLRGNGPGRSVRPLGPAVASTLVSLAGFTIWVGAIVLLIRRGVDRQPRARARPADGSDDAAGSRLGTVLASLFLPVMFLLGFALFLVGLRFS